MSFRTQFIKAFANTSGALAAIGIFSLFAKYIYKTYLHTPKKKASTETLCDDDVQSNF
jgi:hypothetical protein